MEIDEYNHISFIFIILFGIPVSQLVCLFIAHNLWNAAFLHYVVRITCRQEATLPKNLRISNKIPKQKKWGLGISIVPTLAQITKERRPSISILSSLKRN